MVKFRELFRFSKKEVETSFTNSTPVEKTVGFRILRAPLSGKSDIHGKLLVVASRKVGKAHDRNLVKRRLKAIFYEEKLYKFPFNYIVIVYKNCLKLDFAKLKELFVNAITKDLEKN